MLLLTRLLVNVNTPPAQPSNAPRTSTVLDAGLKLAFAICAAMSTWKVTGVCAYAAMAVPSNSAMPTTCFLIIFFIFLLQVGFQFLGRRRIWTAFPVGPQIVKLAVKAALPASQGEEL